MTRALRNSAFWHEHGTSQTDPLAEGDSENHIFLIKRRFSLHFALIRRVEEAKNQLVRGEESVVGVAYRLGFSSS